MRNRHSEGSLKERQIVAAEAVRLIQPQLNTINHKLGQSKQEIIEELQDATTLIEEQQADIEGISNELNQLKQTNLSLGQQLILLQQLLLQQNESFTEQLIELKEQQQVGFSQLFDAINSIKADKDAKKDLPSSMSNKEKIAAFFKKGLQ